MADEEWQGPPGLYVWLLAACSIILYGRRVVSPRVTASCLDRAASLNRLPYSFHGFQRSFLLPFLAGYWAFQQHTLYSDTLYESYGFEKSDLAFFLALGQASALLLGPFACSAADSLGRKRACILYGVLHLIGCLCKSVGNFYAMCFAHTFLGLAASLFGASFEGWIVAEHEKMGFKQELLIITFCLMTFGASVTGIAIGPVASIWVQVYGVSSTAVAAAVSAGLCVALVGAGWGENRAVPQVTISKALSNGLRALHDKNVLLLGLAQNSVHFAISVFWLLWTPTLVADGRHVQLGKHFVQLMASMMLGSIIALCLMVGPWFMQPEKFLAVPLFLSAYMLFIAAYDYQNVAALVFALCGFQICMGIVLPSLARLRSLYLPSDRRCSVMSLGQIPSNAVLWFIFARSARLTQFDNSTTFWLCVFALSASAIGLLFLSPPKRNSPEALLVERP